MIKVPEVDDTTYDLCELLGGDGRDFLIRSNGDRVNIGSLKGTKIVLIYLCDMRRDWDIYYTTPLLLQLYRQIGRHDFEVVMVLTRGDEELLNAHFAQTPWLAVPHADSEAVTSRMLAITHTGYGLWNLTVVDKSGKILMPLASDAIRFYGHEAYPFTRERIIFLNDREAAAKRDRSIHTLLGNDLVSGSTRELEGKTVALFFQNPSPDQGFIDLLARVHNQLRDRGEEFEVVFVPSGHDLLKEEFCRIVNSMPWFALQRRSSHAKKLWYYSKDPDLPKPTGATPFVYIISPDFKILTVDGARFIRLYGADAFPFMPERLHQVEMEEKQRPLTLETLLAFHGLDFVVRRDGSKVAVADQLVGKTVMLYLDRIVSHKHFETFRRIKEKESNFEVVCVGLSNPNLDLIEDCMFAFPPNDVRKLRVLWLLSEMTGWYCVPKAILLDSSCRVVRGDCDDAICIHGADAYPFTDDHLERLGRRVDANASSWPKRVRHNIHQHVIDCVVCDEYDCDGCYWAKNRWNFRCTECRDFNLHADYAFGEDNGEGKPEGRGLMTSFITNKMTY